MKKLAIIAPSIYPVPAVTGGSVETLTTYFVQENELNPQFHIDVYCCENPMLKYFSYQYTTIHQVKKPAMYKACSLYCKIVNRLYRLLKIHKSKSYFDKLISNAIELEKYEYVLVENNMNVFECLQKKKDEGCQTRFLFHLHNDVMGSFYNTKDQCENVYKNCEKVFCASQYILDRMKLACGGDVDGKLVKLTNCIDSKSFKKIDSKDVNDLRKAFHIEKDTFVVLYSGRIAPEKGVEEVVKAVCLLPNDMKVVCIILGGNWRGSRIERKIVNELKEISSNKSEKFIFAGYVEYEDIPKYYQMADVTVVPSKWKEPFGMAALEALSMGCPIIVSNQGGLKDIPDENSGFLIDSNGDMSIQISNAIEKIYKLNDVDKNRMRAAAIRRVESEFFDTAEYFRQFYISLQTI